MSRGAKNRYYQSAKLRRRQLHRASKKSRAADGKGQPSEPASYFPINKLPREVLAEIFVLCLPDLELPEMNGSSSKRVAPLLLCNVCSSWRALARYLPRLWQRLFLVYSDAMPKTREEDNATALTDAWLQRSKKLPLTLSLRVIGSLPDRSKRDLHATAQSLLFTLADHASRWEYVHLSWIFCPPLLIPGLEDTPYLRSFNMTASRPVMAPFPFSSCPKLTQLSWPYAFDVSSSRDMPWHQLTCLRLEYPMPTSEILLLLQACPKLIELRIEVDDCTDEELPRAKVKTRHGLQKLHLTVDTECECLFKRLTLPALIDFTLHMDDAFASIYGVHDEQLLRLFSRSKCRLDRLQLQNCYFDDESFLRCLQHPSCAFLTELNIINVQHYPMFTDTVFAALTEPITGDSYALLPYLKRLSLEMCLAGSPGILGIVILSRCLSWEKEDQLTYLSLVEDEIHVLDYLRIKLAEDQGLRTRFAFTCADLEVMDE